MNTHGHESVARNAGLPVMTAALERGGRRSPRLGAFRLGNWLTDVSQLVDPVATAAGVEALKKATDQFLDEVQATIYYKRANELVQLAEHVSLDELIARLKRQLRASIDYYILVGNDSRRSELAKLIRASYRLQGYFKFAHPETPGEDPPMDVDAFFKVFDAFYTQYFPHEHLDRPEILPARTPPEFATDKADGPRAVQQKLTPDLYAYLRDDIEMAAGLLAELDLEWAPLTFSPHATVDDRDVNWNMRLAEFGHALHAVEDFFAHSNFVEHASLLLGSEFLPKSIERNDQQTFLRRLKAYVPASTADWRTLPNEDYIVTGYFDASDTLISIAHLAEALIGLDVEDPLRQLADDADAIQEFTEHPDVPIYQAQRLLQQTLDFLHDPEAASKNKDNEVAQKLQDLKNRIASDYAKAKGVGAASREISTEVSQRLFKEFPVFQNVDPRVKEDIVNYVVLMARAVQVGKDVMTGYRAVKTIVDFVGGPLEWLTAKLGEKFKEFVKDAVIFYARERVHDLIGQDRIGCHSLLAKDHGGEWLYAPMKDCATAVHWYVVTTMARWGDPAWRGHSPRPDSAKWVNWLELLEFFLRHPRSPAAVNEVQVTIPVTIVHVVVDTPQHSDSLASLAQKYRKTAVHSATFTWETIANANFDTANLSDRDRKNVVNATLKAKGWGYPVHMKPNFAFKAGLHVLIPDQRLSLTLVVPNPASHEWYRAVMKHGWKAFTGYEDPKEKQSIGPIDHHALVYGKDRTDVRAIVRRGEALRVKAEKAYRP